MLVTTDNNCGSLEREHFVGHEENLKKIANKKIEELVKDNNDVLIFPHCLGVTEDNINDNNVFDLTEKTLTTNNIMGFIGVNETQLKIESRFAQVNKNNHDDFFLHYMLQKVFCINLFDLHHGHKQESIFDLLAYIFPSMLKKALSQGLYKHYQKRQYNDANVKGAIDLPTHLRKNIPFCGTLAYKVREHSFDNHITQLIRHTIEYIKYSRFSVVLHGDPDIQNFINIIIQNTPSYNRRDRQAVIKQNIKPFCHPYYYEYANLQKICLKILRFEGLRYSQTTNKTYGILFDGAWLWEEYLNTLLCQLNFTHPENKTGRDPIYVFSGNKYTKRYPDFYNNTIVIDAKYKKIEGNGSRDDLNQIISYMYLMQLPNGAFLTPSTVTEMSLPKELNGVGGELYKMRLAIPKGSEESSEENNFPNFRKEMSINEGKLIADIKESFVNESGTLANQYLAND